MMDLHFIRPELLWLLPVIIPLLLLAWRKQVQGGDWAKAIDPTLLPHLITTEGGDSIRLRQLWWLTLPLLLIGASGPSLERAELPVFEKSDALVIVLDLSRSMWATDTQPSRIRRARQKVMDILDARTEGVTGMVVFAGDAHVVTPLTDDTRTIENLLSALAPDIMPLQGSNASEAIALASGLLETSGLTNGSLLLITDGLPKFDTSRVEGLLGSVGADLGILVMGTDTGAPIPLPDGGFLRDDNDQIVIPAVDRQDIQRTATALGAKRTDVSVDNSDIQSLLSGAQSSITSDDSLERKTDTWIDLGYWLAIVAALLMLPLFRRGALSALLVTVLMTDAAPSHANTLEHFWSTTDQKGAKALAEGDAARAATLFQAPDWRGTAHYEAGDFRSSSAEFGKLDSADALYNRGNALALSGDFQGAIDSYDRSLEVEPDRQDAIDNRELVKSLLEQQQQEQQGNDQDSNSDQSDQEGESQDSESDSSQQEQDSSESQEGSSDPSDQQPSDQESQPSADGEMSEDMNPSELEQATEEQLARFNEALEEQQALEQWLRRVPDDPGGLLRRKFRYQTIQRLRNGEEPDEDVRW
ncbi:MAG: VWA domain-containing protein [Luminiphilus sp.]|nr:VWA domain-containing protein [Luminiphilus sp.]